MGIHVHVAVGRVWEHQQLGALFVPEDGGGWIAGGGTVEFHNTVEADFLVFRGLDESRWCCKKIVASRLKKNPILPNK